MNMLEKRDLVIIGGGCAGLSLAIELAQQNIAIQTTILEPRPEYQNDRTWSFWAKAKHPLSHLVHHRWSDWSYGVLGAPRASKQDPGFPYQTIRSIDFYQHAKQVIGNSTQIDLALDETVHRVAKHEDHWRIETNKRALLANAVVDTRPPTGTQLQSAQMLQCFVGEVISKPGAFSTDTAELMTDMTADAHGFLFSYCLPTSPDTALIEATRFSAMAPDWPILQQDLLKIKTRRGWLDAKVLETEQARLPMGMSTKRSDDPMLVIAGTSAGGLRAASGYGFLRIQRWARACAKALAKDGRPLPHAPDPKLQAWMDRLFLDVLCSHPDQVPGLFFKLYNHLDTKVLIRFMNDESSLLDKLKVIQSLPARPFLRTIFRR